MRIGCLSSSLSVYCGDVRVQLPLHGRNRTLYNRWFGFLNGRVVAGGQPIAMEGRSSGESKSVVSHPRDNKISRGWGTVFRVRAGNEPFVWLTSAQVHHVDIGAEAGVIRQVPAGMIRVFVNDDVVGIPEPAVHKANVIRGNAPIPIPETEAVRVAAGQVPMVRGAEAAFKPPMFPWIVQVIVRIVTPGVVADPALAVVDMRGIGMAGVVAVVGVFLGRTRLAMIRLGASLGRRT